MPLKSSEKQTNSTTDSQKNATVYEAEPQQSHKDVSLPRESRPVVRKNSMKAAVTPFEPTATCSNNTYTTIGQDLWRQVKLVQVAVFAGKKKNRLK